MFRDGDVIILLDHGFEGGRRHLKRFLADQFIREIIIPADLTRVIIVNVFRLWINQQELLIGDFGAGLRDFR